MVCEVGGCGGIGASKDSNWVILIMLSWIDILRRVSIRLTCRWVSLALRQVLIGIEGARRAIRAAAGGDTEFVEFGVG